MDGEDFIYEYDEDDKLITFDSAQATLTYEYDNNGNMISSSDGKTYSYNYENMMISFDSTQATASYKYDGMGNRIAVEIDGIEKKFLVDSNRRYVQVVVEWGESISPVPYILGARARKIGDYYPLYDGHGSVIALSDENGVITDTYDYTPYGKIRNLTGTTINPYQYSGERTDSETGFQYLRARYYNTEVERFTSRDTWAGVDSEPITLNKYLYGNGNPVRYVDPSGHMSLSDIVAAQTISTILTSSMSYLAPLFGPLVFSKFFDDLTFSDVARPLIGGSLDFGFGPMSGIAGFDSIIDTSGDIWLYHYLGVGANIIPRIGVKSFINATFYAGAVFNVNTPKDYTERSFAVTYSHKMFKKLTGGKWIPNIPLNAIIFSDPSSENRAAYGFFVFKSWGHGGISYLNVENFITFSFVWTSFIGRFSNFGDFMGDVADGIGERLNKYAKEYSSGN